MKTLHIKNISLLLLLLATSLFASYSHAATVTKYLYAHTTVNETAEQRQATIEAFVNSVDQNTVLNNGYNSKSQPCQANGYSSTFATSTITVNGVNYPTTKCKSGPAYGYSVGFTVTLTPQEQCNADGKFWNASTSTCEVIPTCTASQTYNSTTNKCDDDLISTCQNLPAGNITLTVKVTEDAGPELNTIPTNLVQYVAHNGCQYHLESLYPVGQTSSNCYTFTNDPKPKAGYCDMSYSPTYAVSSNETESLQDITTIDPPETCIDGTITLYGACKMQCDINTEWANKETTRCEPKAECPPDGIYNSDNNTCDIPACPTGQYRPTPTSACEETPPCPDGKTKAGLSCVTNGCPDGQYRTDIDSACIPKPTDLNLATCANTVTVKSTTNSVTQRRLSKCAESNGLKPYHVPNTDYCAFPSIFVASQNGDQYVYCQTSVNPAYYEEYLGDPPTEQRAILNCPYGYSHSSLTQCEIQTSPMQCASGKVTNQYGHCVDANDPCLTNPNLAECQQSGSGGNGDCADEPEKCELLTNIKDELTIDADMQAKVQSIQSGQFLDEFNRIEDETALAIDAKINEFIDDSALLTAYKDLIPESPWDRFLGVGRDCVLETSVLGHQMNFSLCEAQPYIHPVLDFALFVLLLFGVFALIFERPAGSGAS